ncbi:MAG: translation initiation factor IF-2 [Deltaproteobacteria bacterium]|nr:MAG: translation initiation factor IF-2 [Deltaproteobacteria bacterium]
MAKVRVYELAKELKMESKVLVEKLQSGGMNIKNYMSTLDEEAVKRARDIALGVVSEEIEEKRVKPTVIRRRKKIKIKKEDSEVSEKAPAGTEPAPETAGKPDAEVEQVGVAEKPVEETEPGKEISSEEPGEAVRPEEPEVMEKPAVEVEAKPEKETRKEVKARKPRKKKTEQPARIIKTGVKVVLEEAQHKTPVKKTARPESLQLGIVPGPEVYAPIDLAKGVSEEPKEKKSAKKRKAKKKEEDKLLEKSGIFRRRKKEIYERADLYEGRGVVRKGKKSAKQAKADEKKSRKTEITVPKAIKRKIKVPEIFTIGELAKAMGVKAAELIKNLLAMGQIVNINQPIDFETASVVADDFGYELELDTFQEVDLIAETKDKPEDLVPRPPVVTIMGHVDHGKTLLLDYIRKSNVIKGESGGITQHIGAYYVKREEGDIVFLDTPGHEAFTAMRARGAEVTDIIVLVVAADDGVMPQTRESIDHARAANIPIVVAINKIDKPDANPEKIKRDLAAIGVAAEDWGGETLFAEVSAKTGQGVDELLNLILLQAEMLELKANPKKAAKGTVIEAKLDKSKGPVATVLVKNGTLRPGDQFICGQYYGRVRAMNNHRGKTLKSAGPSVPVEVYGISGVPMAGDEFVVVQDEKTAKQISEHRKKAIKEKATGKRGIVSLDDLYDRIKEGGVKELNIILKADVQGSLEALSDMLLKQSTGEVKLKIIHMATGTISESDVMLASASNAIIIGFNVRANPRVTEIAKNENIDIRYYDVIYNAVKDIRAAMTGLLEPVFKERIIGRAYIKEIFHVPKVGNIAGCQVSDGRIERNANVRLLRDNVVVFDGKIGSLRRFKEDVKEVQSGYECGIGLENYNDIKPGDLFEVYQLEEVEAQL